MKKSTIIFVTVFVPSFFYYYTGRNFPSRAQERYNGNDFTMTLPAGSTPVKVQNKTQPLGEQQMVETSYFFSNKTTAYRVVLAQYSKHTKGTPEKASKATASGMFNPGYSAQFSQSHLDTLPAVASEVEGITIKGKPAYI